MQKSLPSQAEILQWVLMFCAKKAIYAVQNQDWETVLAVSKIMEAASELRGSQQN